MEHALTVVIPAFNEESALGAVLADVRAAFADVPHAIIVVDDGSTDGSGRVAAEHGARVVTHPSNLGYGAALKSGMRLAASPLVATMDADGQHGADALKQLWLRRDEADMIVGARSGLRHSRTWRMPGKWLLNALARYLSGQTIPDLNSGLRVYHRDVLARYIHLCPSGFSFTTTMTLALLSRGWRVAYVPIEIKRRRVAGHSTVSVMTGLDTLVLVLRIVSLFNPMRVFMPVAALVVALGVLWGVPIALAGRGISVGSMLAIVTGVLLFALGLLCDQISQLRLERFE